MESARPKARQDRADRLDHNDDIEPVGKVLDVIKIIFELQPGSINSGYIALMTVRRGTSNASSFGIVFFVTLSVVILSAIFPGAILVDAIEDDAGNAFLGRHLLYGSLDQLAGR